MKAGVPFGAPYFYNGKMKSFKNLEEITSQYLSPDELNLLKKASIFAEASHKGQFRASGEPYISHPIAVAEILAEMKLDVASIITGLLHDTVEDTEVTLEEVEDLFGGEVAKLVDGVTKLTRIEGTQQLNQQAENFRKLLLAMSNDIRVLLIKLIDRLHNMTTLSHLSSKNRRRKIALETIEIYAPLAERIGMYAVQEQLQNLSFKELNPEAYDMIIRRLDYLHREGNNIVGTVISDLKKILELAGVDTKVYGREKTPYSIWRKMQNNNVSFEQLSDIIAFRIIVNTVSECYQALGSVHSAYLVLPGRFKDYISTPKPNHYQSIHTTVIGPHQRQIEIQIRTQEMHDISEHGVAAHWQYKQGVQLKDGKQYRWLRGLVHILEHSSGPDEFLENTKLEMFHDQVFCFTPKGDLIALPRGATAIDFAYAVHSDVGNHCKSVKINGRLMPLRAELDNGDQVEVITSVLQEPSATWDRFVVTGKARASIRKYTINKQRVQFISLGKSILKRVFEEEEEEFTPDILEGVLKNFSSKNVDDLYAFLGDGSITAQQVLKACFPEREEISSKSTKQRNVEGESASSESFSRKPLAIKGLSRGVAIHYAGCCHPLPGDKIVGIVTTGKGIHIHRLNCTSLLQFENEPSRWIDVSWGETDGEVYCARIFVMLKNKRGSLGSIATTIGAHGGNIVNLNITRRHEDFYDLLIDVDVINVDVLKNIIAALRGSSTVGTVERVQ